MFGTAYPKLLLVRKQSRALKQDWTVIEVHIHLSTTTQHRTIATPEQVNLQTILLQSRI